MSSKGLVFDPSNLQTQPTFPKEFIWPTKKGDFTTQTSNHGYDHNHIGELNEPLVDLDGFLKGDQEATKQAMLLVNKACLTHGFFQVKNHGVDPRLIRAAHENMDGLFKLPLEKKLRVQRKVGELWGYSGGHSDRFSKELPWKETFSFKYDFVGAKNEPMVVHYFKSTLGEDFKSSGWVYQRYCEAMKDLSLVIFELLGVSLGVEREEFRKFYEDGSSMLRCNSYPKCKEPQLTYGTGPHCDPTSLTILHQDQVGGLQVFANNIWQSVTPRPDAFVINIGDTFMALSNGRYKSCLHTAMVNKYQERRSLAYFVSPKEDKIVRAPQDIFDKDGKRRYPDFKWPHLLEFTQKHHRADFTTLQCFFKWLTSNTR